MSENVPAGTPGWIGLLSVLIIGGALITYYLGATVYTILNMH